jgi:C4-type Zn-finger protein
MKMLRMGNKKFIFKVCPVCGGDVEYAGISSGYIFPGINTAQKYVCKNCGYQGALVLEVSSLEYVKHLQKKYQESLSSKTDQTHRIKTDTLPFSEKWVWLWRLVFILFIANILYTISRLF